MPESIPARSAIECTLLYNMALPRPSRYPIMMSSDIPWASGVGPNAIMQQKHDVDLLDEELRWGGGEGL